MDGQLNQGQLFGDYEILSLAGYGGMGVVYRAEQRSLARLVALKVIKPAAAADLDFRARFLREARLASAIDHPHVVTVYDTGEVDGSLFLAMQWVDGQDLARVLRQLGQLPPERAVRIIAQVAGALDAVHGAGLLHRDVKPGNVLVRQLGEEDHAYLTDFGVAKPAEDDQELTRTGAVVGTVGYLAPEQIRGARPSPRSDLYALGCLFFEAIAGVAPFEEENELALRWAHANSERPLLSAVLASGDRRYDEFMRRALSIDPEERFATGREFAKALVAAHEQSATTEPRPATVTTAAMSAAVAAEATRAAGPLTPPPAQAMTPPALGGYGYVTPQPPPAAALPAFPPPTAPSPPAPARSGNSLALILLALVALAGVAVGALAASGAFSHKGSTTLASSPTSTPASRSTPTTPAKTTTHPAANTRGAMKSCGGDVSVRAATTSCAFGQSVEQAYMSSSGGTTDVSAFSPVTGASYTMHCTGATPHVCTGGQNAEVVFSATPSGQTAPSGPPAGTDTTGMHACDQNISVNHATTCPFADNVFVAYWRAWQQSGDQSDRTVSAHSNATGQDYTMDCTTDTTSVWCVGGNHAYVTFPLQAVHVYTGP